MQVARSQHTGPLRVSTKKLGVFLQGLPVFLMLAWVTKAFSPDFRAKSALLSRDLELRLEIVSSSQALWKQLLLPMFTMVCLLWIIRSRKVLTSYLIVLSPMLLFGIYLVLTAFGSEHPDDTARRAIRQILLFLSLIHI